MKKLLIMLCLCCICTPALANTPKIGVVDLNQLVAASPEVKKLKTEQDAKVKEINAILEKARLELSKETDATKLEQLQTKYTSEINAKKSALEKSYNAKITAVENSIKQKVSEKAKADGYDYVFAKSVLLHGGEDITPALLGK